MNKRPRLRNATVNLKHTLGFTRSFPDWRQFVDYLADNYLKLDSSRREVLLFRGQPDHRWRLEPSLDRAQAFADEISRNAFADRLLAQYRLAIQPLHEQRIETLFNEEELEMHARHHGIPTCLLDFTRSPFCASYFAFAEAMALPSAQRPQQVAIFRFAPTRLPEDVASKIEVRECDGRSNHRAAAQRSVFLRLNSNDKYLDAVAPKAFSKYLLPFVAGKDAMTWLESMGISPAALFPGHDGAARTVCQKNYIWEAE